jgi:hypothetical protein
MGSAARWLAVVAVALLASALFTSASAGRREPIAHVACSVNATGTCSETGSVSLPANGYGSQSTDVVPVNAKSATEDVNPYTAGDAATFDQQWVGIVEAYPHLGSIKSRVVRGVITCVIFARGFANALTDDIRDDIEANSTAKALFPLLLGICLNEMVRLQQRAQAGGQARAASAGCAHGTVSIPVMIKRTAHGYQLTASAKTVRPPRKPALNVTCGRHGPGMRISITPRARGARLGPLVGPQLSLGYANPANKPVVIKTTFTFHQ